jgi:hypothetical protein
MATQCSLRFSIAAIALFPKKLIALSLEKRDRRWSCKRNAIAPRLNLHTSGTHSLSNPQKYFRFKQASQ